MVKARIWALAALFVVGMAGVTALVPESRSATEEKRVAGKDHWRHHDGRWSYWHEGDKRWYYTDGSNWFYDSGAGWNVYGFDKQFGRDGFERGEYRVPGKDHKVVVPTHKTYRPR
jgi:hypothetical protein